MDNKRVRIELEQWFAFTNGKAQCKCITDPGITCDAVMHPSTQTLKRHLKRKHIVTFERCLRVASELSTNVQSQLTASPAASVSSSSSIPLSDNEVSAIKKKSTCDAEDFIIGLVVDKGVALNWFENEHWKKYMGQKFKKLGVSNNRDGIKTMLIEREKKLQKTLTNTMKNKSIVLKIDCWKQYSHKYFAVNVQFFDRTEMKVQDFTLAISEITDNQTLKHLVEKTMEKFKIHDKQVIAVVSDNTADMIGPMEQLSQAEEEEDEKTLESLFPLNLVKCGAHSLQLAIGDGLRKCGFQHVIAEIRHIYQRAHDMDSTIASDWRNTGHVIPLKLDTAARWDSTFLMIDGAIKAKNTIHTLEADHSELYMDEEKWEQMVVVREALEPAYTTTKAIQKLSMTPGEFFYKWKLLEHTLTKLDSIVAQKIAEEMTAGTSQLFENDILLAGIYIDPKSRDLLTTEEQQRGKTLFIDLAVHLHVTAEPSASRTSTSGSSSPGETPSRSSLVEPCPQESFEEQLKVKAQERINQKQQHDGMESKQYKKLITQQIEVLDVQDRSKGLIESIFEYPTALQQACLVTSAMPTTSVSIERLLSYVEFMESDKRPNYYEEPLNGLVFLRTNGIY